ncbi:putative type II secretion system protein E [Abditibacteriota bacterium]|nr:putative type II secretion system protein E [Abditibacteriota bacterium]
MTTPSSPSRAEELLREAIEMGAEELYLQADGERTKVRYRVAGRIVQKLTGFISDAQSMFAELKSFVTQQVFADENEGMGYFSFSAPERTVWIRVYWFRDEDADSLAISLLERWVGFDDLGLSLRDAATLDELISAPHGVIIGCGKARDGHATTLKALLERLVQNGKRVVLLAGLPDPRLENVTQIDVASGDLSEHIELLAGHFDVFALEALDSNEKMRVAFDLAAEGHLVLALYETPYLGAALDDFLNSGISAAELRAHFLGGWSQTLVPHSNQQERIGLFHCMSREAAQAQILDGTGANMNAIVKEEKKALRRDAEEKIAAGLVTPEDADRIISQA